MTCCQCRRQFKENDRVQYTGLSIYHVVPIPKGDQFNYAVERPYCITNIRHTFCGDE